MLDVIRQHFVQTYDISLGVLVVSLVWIWSLYVFCWLNFKVNSKLFNSDQLCMVHKHYVSSKVGFGKHVFMAEVWS